MKKRDRNIFLSKNNSVFFKNFDIEYDIDLENTDIKNPLLKTEFMNIDRSDVKHLIYEGDSTNTNNLEMIIIEWTNSVDNCQLPKWNYLDTNLILNERIIEFLNYEKKETFCHCEDKCNNITFCPCARFNFLFNQTISYNYEIKMESKNLKKKKVNRYRNDNLNKRILKKISPQIQKFEIFECGNSCTCNKSKCQLSLLNSLSESSHFIMKDNLYVKRVKKSCEFNGNIVSEVMWGLFSKIYIPRNVYIIDYVGLVITNRDAEERGKIADKIGISYLFDMCEPDSETIENYLKASGKVSDGELKNNGLEDDDFPLVVDATDNGNLSRFINHSCNPNLKTQLVHIDYIDPRYSKIAFFSKKDIKAHTELTFDYSYQGVTAGKDLPCLCGTLKCRGLLVSKIET